jgi:purine-binding chemotaxis protein CheW
MSQTLTTQAGQTVLLATFFVRDALCALDANGVQEVIRLGPVTSVRYAPEEVLGIVNLRGKIVTIVDLGLRLGFPKAVAGADSRIFIVEDRGEFIGLLVDRKIGWWRWSATIEPPPANVNWGQAQPFKGAHSPAGVSSHFSTPARFWRRPPSEPARTKKAPR